MSDPPSRSRTAISEWRVQEQVGGKPLLDRMVVAYIIGVALPQEITQFGLPVGSGPSATGCLITWNSVRRYHEELRRLELIAAPIPRLTGAQCAGGQKGYPI